MSDCADEKPGGMGVHNVAGEDFSGTEPSPPKRKGGNPAFYKGMPPLPGAGRPKGSKNKTTILRERLEEFKFDPVVKLIKAYEEIDDPVQRAKIALELTKGVYEVVGKTSTVNVNERSVQIVWTYGSQPSQEELQAMEAELGLARIEHQPAAPLVIEAEPEEALAESNGGAPLQ